MVLAGELTVNGISYFLASKDLAKVETFYLISKIHKDDLFETSMGEEAKYPVMTGVSDLGSVYNEGYLIGAVKKSKVTGVVKKVGNADALNVVLEALRYAKCYHFGTDSIKINDTTVNFGKEDVNFYASDNNLTYSFLKSDGVLQRLLLQYRGTKMDLQPVKFNPDVKGLEYVEVKNSLQRNLQIATLSTVSYEQLKNLVDLSWYEDAVTHQKKKDYKSVKSTYEFETLVMQPLIDAIVAAQEKGEVVDVGLDVETTGLNIYDLSDDNEDKDRIVTIQLSWEDNQGVIIFFDMEHFANVDKEYVLNRLDFLRGFYEEQEITIFDVPEVSNTVDNNNKSQTSALIAFEDDFGIDNFDDVLEDAVVTEQLVDSNRELYTLVPRTVRIKRNAINLTGHNVMFDARVCFSEGHTYWFNDDTLQISFNINPQSVRGDNKLKNLTRRILQHETPELTTILGKGNEDKFRYLQDEEVVKVYGCADTDYARLILKVLRKLLGPELYQRYRLQDMPLINILAQSEYWGMTTDYENVVKLANTTVANIKRLQEYCYSYVGNYIEYRTKLNKLKYNLQAGLITEEEYDARRKSVTFEDSAYYEFDFKASQLRQVLFEVLGYPVISYTEGANPLPKVDKYVIKKLLREKYKNQEGNPGQLLKHDIISTEVSIEEYNRLKAGTPSEVKKAKSLCLISAEEFNKLKYPLALIVQKYSELNKEFTSYYNPIINENKEGKLFKGYNMARIETRRISNPGQTMKGSLKAMILPSTDDFYNLDFDMSQIEFRLMASLSEHTPIIKKMKNPESDYHTETASMVNHIPPHMVTKKQRKAAKSVSFGIPYGLGEYSLCESMFGEVNEDTLFKTRLALADWIAANEPIMNYLEEVRNNALKPVPMSDDLREFLDMYKKEVNPKTKKKEYVLDTNGNKIPQPVGRVYNKYSFSRMFPLSDGILDGSDKSAIGKIRRPAGNYPIQSFAAEVFRIILIRFYNACRAYGIEDKVRWHMLIHDELLCSVHKSVNPFLMYKIVKQACMITFKGHTNYYVGINIGNSWAECKDDAREAPVIFVDRMIEKYDRGELNFTDWWDNPWQYIEPLRTQYLYDRVYEVVKLLQPNIDNEPIDIPLLLDTFTNYTVRSYVYDFPAHHTVDYKVDKDDEDSVKLKDDLEWESRMESWALRVFGEGKQMITINRGVITVMPEESNNTPDTTVSRDDMFVDYDELFAKEGLDDAEDDYWVIGDNGLAGSNEFEEEELPGFFDEMDYKIDTTRKATSLSGLVVVEEKYKTIKFMNDQIVVPTHTELEQNLTQSYFSDKLTKNGIRVFVETSTGLQRLGFVKKSTDLQEVDKALTLLLNDEPSDGYKNLKCIDDIVSIKVKSVSEYNELKQIFSRYSGDKYSVLITVDNTYTMPAIKLKSSVSIKKIDEMLNDWR